MKKMIIYFALLYLSVYANSASAESRNQNLASKDVKEIQKIIDKTYKTKIKKACGDTSNCVVLIANNKINKTKSINEAVYMASIGDVIWIGSGEYFEILDLNNRKNITIIGNNTSVVTDKDEGIINISECSNITLYGLHIVHKTGENCSHNCLNIHNSENINIVSNDIDGSGYMGIFTLSSKNLKIINNKIHNCTVGINAHPDNTIQLINNQFYENKESNFGNSNLSLFQSGWENVNKMEGNNIGFTIKKVPKRPIN